MQRGSLINTTTLILKINYPYLFDEQKRLEGVADMLMQNAESPESIILGRSWLSRTESLQQLLRQCAIRSSRNDL